MLFEVIYYFVYNNKGPNMSPDFPSKHVSLTKFNKYTFHSDTIISRFFYALDRLLIQGFAFGPEISFTCN